MKFVLSLETFGRVDSSTEKFYTTSIAKNHPCDPHCGPK